MELIPIASLHPLSELLAAILAVWSFIVCDGWAAAIGMLLGWQLLALALIDWRTMLLPRALTAGLIVSGLAAATVVTKWPPVDQLMGAAVGYVAFQAITWAYGRLRQREGMGSGDAKLLAGLGAWVGWQGLPTVVTYAAVSALAYVLSRRLGGAKITAETAVPFGPFLALGGWLVWLYGPMVLQANIR